MMRAVCASVRASTSQSATTWADGIAVTSLTWLVPRPPTPMRPTLRRRGEVVACVAAGFDSPFDSAGAAPICAAANAAAVDAMKVRRVRCSATDMLLAFQHFELFHHGVFRLLHPSQQAS